MDPIVYIDRVTGERNEEKVYGEKALRFLYGKDLWSKLLGAPILHLSAKWPLISSLYGWWQSLSLTKSKVGPFIRNFGVDPTEFEKSPKQFTSFNDFFVRKLKSEARPIKAGNNTAVIPADARYFFYQNIAEAEGFVVKGKKFDLGSLLEDEALAKQYTQGTMVMARLCPSDYHRFHFPCDCTPDKTRWINGWLYSVNPIAIRHNIDIFTQNKRTLCKLDTEEFGEVLYLEIGATNVGSIHHTYTPNKPHKKGDEKGYFAFGASSLILLFPPNRLKLCDDLVAATAQDLEIRCLIGQPLGTILKKGRVL